MRILMVCKANKRRKVPGLGQNSTVCCVRSRAMPGSSPAVVVWEYRLEAVRFSHASELPIMSHVRA